MWWSEWRNIRGGIITTYKTDRKSTPYRDSPAPQVSTIHRVITVPPDSKKQQGMTCSVKSGCPERSIMRSDKIHRSVVRELKSKQLRLLEPEKDGLFVIFSADLFNGEAMKAVEKNFSGKRARPPVDIPKRVSYILKTQKTPVSPRKTSNPPKSL